MLRPVLGPAGSGKTSFLLDLLEEKVKAGERVLLIVPEQASFEYEKLVFRRTGMSLSNLAEVVGFTRLSELIFRQYGGLAGQYIDDTAKLILMSASLDTVKDRLLVYGKNAFDTGLLSKLLQVIAELKHASLSPDMICNSATAFAGQELGDKMLDLGEIYSVYQAMLERSFVDQADDLTRASKILEANDFFAGCTVLIDSFTSFLFAEWRIIEQAIAQADDCYITICADRMHDETGGMGVFSVGQETLHRAIRLANQQGIAVAKPVVLDELHRFHTPALKHLAGQLYALQPQRFDGACDSIQLIAAPDSYKEIEAVAAEIAALVRKGARYHEIAVIGRSLDRYWMPIQSVFERYDIPWFADIRQDIKTKPLIRALLNALDAVSSRTLDISSAISLLKSPLFDFGEAEIGLFENYCYLWSLKGDALCKEFTAHPRGLEETMTEIDKQQLITINRVRKALVEPLLTLKGEISNCNGRTFALALYQFTQELEVSKALRGYLDRLPADQLGPQQQETEALWKIFLSILDSMVLILGESYHTPAHFSELFRTAVSTADFGMLPQTLDQVIVGAADRIRVPQLKIVFVIGANEGEFPAQVGGGGLLTESDRANLMEMGIELGQSTRQKTVQEKYFAYHALTTPEEKLYLSWIQMDAKGAVKLPSSLLLQVQSLFSLPMNAAFGQEGLERLQNEECAFWRLGEMWGENSTLRSTLAAYFTRHDAGRLARLESAAHMKPMRLDTKMAARQVYQGDMTFSPSRIEQYYQCPFSYFCSSTLGLKARRKVEFSPIQSGSVIHACLEQLIGSHTGKELYELSEQALREEIAGVVNGYFAARVSEKDQLSRRFSYLYTRLIDRLVQLVRHLAKELSQSAFVPTHFELPVTEDGQEAKAMQLQLEDGSKVTVEGIIDRVDVFTQGQTKYIRVIDYKSGNKEFKLSDVYYGLSMQMLIYLFSLCRDEENANCFPAGVLYMPAKYDTITVEPTDSAQKIEQERNARMRMNGLLLDDPLVLSAMEKEVAGVFIPAKRNADGSMSQSSSVAALAQMGRLRSHIERMVCEMGNALKEGKIARSPAILTGKKLVCDFCEFTDVCGHMGKEFARELPAVDKRRVLGEVKGGEEDG